MRKHLLSPRRADRALRAGEAFDVVSLGLHTRRPVGGVEVSWPPSAIPSCYCNASGPQRHDPTHPSLWFAGSHPCETEGGSITDPTIWSMPALRAWRGQ